MTITFLGTGTSQGVPVIACTCPVCLSTDKHDKRLRTSILIEGEGKVIAIDSGPDFRYQMLREKVMHLDAIVFTHEHKDHVAGMDDIRAFNYKQQMPMDIYADDRVQLALRREFPYIFDNKGYPGIPQVNLHTVTLEPFNVGDVHFTPIEVMHYKLPVKGYRIKDFTYITDAKTLSEVEKDKIRGSKILVINALQKEKHISHFTLDEAIAFARDIGAKQTYLTHISHRLGKHADVSIELPAGIYLAYDGLKLEI
ncbi:MULTISPECIES: MBL fold metallo-hydrolase [unclassified Mucilaginibacter]|uniref:MBL fold metallo-hydrolase n=1 Tax=unclassified Mucilaginibacter TaxID=2617802 RepID=UPI002AC9CA90|nr:MULTISPECIES: MBL fold metallo-hydrolase [unclassified Mucilaginibacter]MEB0262174.1 MBL fold metallo-hydrolase [Mucilaginibacter sp. 10I4]MEB0277034.1 MBL fold metallo-hydrolase [Mucilaginibacter sp. 10B2]MEB0302653.1 MBL fold metallo-hydrolase [Mucilaginibacter sp. 5C4]WPX25135.1 MBL fold metallo-hydrolase [Mucilaginibacter sp. 5C4]